MSNFTNVFFRRSTGPKLFVPKLSRATRSFELVSISVEIQNLAPTSEHFFTEMFKKYLYCLRDIISRSVAERLVEWTSKRNIGQKTLVQS